MNNRDGIQHYYCGAVLIFSVILFRCLVLSTAAAADMSEIITDLDAEKLLSTYSSDIQIRRKENPLDQWKHGLELRSGSSSNAFIFAYKVLPDEKAAKKEFFRLQVMESTGGKAAPFQVGDEAVMFGPNRIMFRRHNVLVTIYPEKEAEFAQLKSFALFIDKKIHTRESGVLMNEAK